MPKIPGELDTLETLAAHAASLEHDPQLHGDWTDISKRSNPARQQEVVADTGVHLHQRRSVCAKVTTSDTQHIGEILEAATVRPSVNQVRVSHRP